MDEWQIGADDVLVSRTNRQGRIEFVNDAFVRASGYTAEELVGRPHNIVRHPDMPKAAFADLWATIRAGRAWEGLVKNRRKDGRFYWVRANVTPVVEGGQVTGFLSVRTCPQRQEVAAAEQLYQSLRREGPQSIRLRGGEVRPAGLGGWFWRMTHSLSMRLHGAFAGLTLFLTLMAGTGLGALWAVQQAIAAPDADMALMRDQIGLYADALILLLLGGLVFALLAGFLLRRGMSAPLARLAQHLEAITQDPRRHTIEMPKMREFALVTGRLRVLRAQLAYRAEEAAESERRVTTQRLRAVREMAETVEKESTQAVARVAQRTGLMAKDADAMADSADRVGRASGGVAAAADQALANAQAVAAAAEQLSASIGAIADRIVETSDSTQAAVAQGEAAMAVIDSLSRHVEGIGSMADLIAEIASQTNLLALNATIEAVRAGEAGRGFAIVAQEVKHLATQTAHSTDAIRTRITDIRTSTAQAVAAVAGIGQRIQQIDRVAGAIAEGMAQQTAATQEITRNVVETTQAAHQVSTLIAAVAGDAAAAGAQADGVRANASDVEQAVQHLRSLLVRVVRTSTPDADRRTAPRYPTDLTCDVSLDTPQGRHPVRLVELSAGGATLHGLGLSRPDVRGRVHLPGAAEPVPFAIRALAPGGAHVSFDSPLPDGMVVALAAPVA